MVGNLGRQSACLCRAGTEDLRGAGDLPTRAHAENSACDHDGSPIPVPVCADCAQRSGPIGDQFTPGLGGAKRIDAYVGEETGPEFPGSDWCLTLGAAIIRAAA